MTSWMSSIRRKRSSFVTESLSGHPGLPTTARPEGISSHHLKQLISKNQEKYYASLSEKKFRDREQKFLVEGVRLCEELIGSELNVEAVVHCPDLASSARAQSVIARFGELGTPVAEASQVTLSKISQTIHCQGVLAVVHTRRSDLEHLMKQKPQTLVALAALNDPGNLGTILRSAAWFGLDGVLIGKNSVEATNPKVVRGSMGAVFHLPIVEDVDVPQAVVDLKRSGYHVILADASGDTPVYSAPFSQKNVVLFGGETTQIGSGIRDLADIAVSIPRIGRGDSLNVAVAAGILFSELARRKAS